MKEGLNKGAIIFLVGGFLGTICVGMSLLFSSVIFPGMNLTLMPYFIIPVLLVFPFSIVLFPWLSATKWWVVDDYIAYHIPAPKGNGKTKTFVNSDFVSLTEETCYLAAKKSDGKVLKLPKTLWSMKKDKLGFTLRNGKLFLENR